VIAAELDRTLAALADPTRRRVVDLLRNGPCRAGELARAVEMSGPAMSRHLRVLRTRGLVEEEHGSGESDARVRTYRLRRQPFASLQSWIEEVTAFWTGQLDSFRAHVENKEKGS